MSGATPIQNQKKANWRNLKHRGKSNIGHDTTAGQMPPKRKPQFGGGNGPQKKSPRNDRQQRPNNAKWNDRKEQGNNCNNHHDTNIQEHSNGKRNYPNEHREKNKRKPFFGYKKLLALLEQSPNEVLMSLSKEKDILTDFMESDKFTGDCIVLLFQVFSIAIESPFTELRASLLLCLANEKALETIKTYIGKIPLQNRREKSFNSKFWDSIEGFFDNIYNVLNIMLDVVTATALDVVPLISQNVTYAMKGLELIEVEVSEECKSQYEKLQLKVIQAVNKKAEKPKKERNDHDEDEDEPPENFREIDIYPSSSEICSRDKKGFLRKNKIQGAYKDPDHYLDVQFRLLRADFLNPLRLAITDYLAGEKRRISNIKIFKGVKSLGNLVVQGESGYLMKVFDPNKMRNLENSRRFMFGSMVCLTPDNFKKIIFGKIIDRELKHLKEGILGIGLHGDTTISETDVFDFVEYGIYFEPYYQVLTALQNIQPDHFPMENYLVYVENVQTQPPYIAQDPDLSEIDVKEMNLNISQKEAFEAALNSEFCIIQGPPGTGKTFLGLKIANTLLKYNKNWKNFGPMLVVCYTNHALDQFLEGLLPSTDKLIRIGGRSQNENLDQYNLRNIRRKFSRPDMAALRELQLTAQKLHTELESFSNLYHKMNNYECIVDFKMFNWNEAVDNELNQIEEEDDYSEEEQFCGIADMNKAKAKKWLLGDEPRRNLDDIAAFLDAMEPNINNEQVVEELDEDVLDDLMNFVEIDDKLESKEKGNNLIWFDPTEMKTELMKKQKELKDMVASGNNQTREFYEQILSFKELERDCEVITGNLQYLRNLKRNNLRFRIDLVGRDEWQLNRNQRWLLYDYYSDLLKPKIRDLCQHLQREHTRAYIRYCEMRDLMDVSFLRGMDVIGMTTTGAARMHKALQALKCPIVIVEEAAEVLEAHVVTALSDGCQHLILIGDHQQLKPTTADYHLTNNYNLGVSLFERMVLNNYHCYTLNVQHRMRPEIANLITPHIYESLNNHDSVNEYPPVRGVVRSLFFINHKHAEAEHSDGSKENRFEAEYLIHLARYLVLNGYEPSRITILAAYSAQFFLMRKLKKSQCLADVRICVLDNYQGEENDIILLSLVRSNPENRIGFLMLKNRVCVALSRAKQGFYLMGNMDMLCAVSHLWREIEGVLENCEALGEAIQLQCMRHTDNITNVKTIEDFRKVPEGGCLRMCGDDLGCGHKCPKLCHASSHSLVKCQENCKQILCDLGHLCPKRCHEVCGRCMVPKSVNLKCGHEGSIPCHMHPDEYDCNVKVSTVLDCGHTVDKPCHIESQYFRCYHKCDIRVEPCGHSCPMQCHFRRDPDHIEFRCLKACPRSMKDCSSEPPHQCESVCWQECPKCDATVKKKRSCGHLIAVNCSEDVETVACPRECNRKLPCGHDCKNQCQDECGPCKIKVDKVIVCGHTLKSPCYMTPNKSACIAKVCPNMLSCGHQCNLPCRRNCAAAQCIVLVPYTGGRAPCGHDNTLVPCYKSKEQVGSWLLEFCMTKCEARLKCGHKCGGTCSECFQGRVHKSCVEPCQKILVCGHSCKNPCRETCRSCTEICNYRCPHNQCRKRCGAICTPCKERCVRQCRHQRCGAICHSKCTVPPCSEPCPKNLKCGHPCIGFCGDPCPPLCRVCDADEVTDIFFGKEDDEGARFVYLPSCKHTFESSGLDTWCEGKIVKGTQNEEIGVLECPKCKMPITAPRYSDQAKIIFADLAKVKEKVFGKYKNSNKLQNELKIRFEALAKKSIVVKRINHWFSEAKKRVYFDQVELDGIRCKLDIIEELLKMIEYLNDSKGKLYLYKADAPIDYFTTLMAKLNCKSATTSEQTIHDFNREILRFRYLNEICSKWSHDLRGNVNYKHCYEMLMQPVPFNEGMHDTVKEAMKNLIGLGVSAEERREILSAMKLSPGHWFKCPNGHVYCITECGGAMETSKCNECGSAIGGSSHQLLGTNSLATEMDGARQPHFPTINNIELYQFD